MSHTLSEYESKALLAEAGIPIPEERLAADADAAVAAAGSVGFPVAAKLCGSGIAHKTERNLVRLGLADGDAVRTAATDLLAARGEGEAHAQVLIAPMAGGRRELICGLVRDPQFGPCVMLGIGGIFAEVVGDVTFAVAPLAPFDAEELIEGLEYASLLGPFRGEPAVDQKRLCAILERLARLGDERPDILSIDINPLIIAGSEPIVIDALVELEGDGR